MSAGAVLTHRIGCELSSRFAAIAPVEGTIAIRPCLPSTPISLFKIHGNADRNIPFYGALAAAVIRKTSAQWLPWSKHGLIFKGAIALSRAVVAKWC